MTQTLNFPAAVPGLRGEIVSLRKLAEDDIPAWFERASDPESAGLAGDPIPESIELGFTWLTRHRERFSQQAGIRWAIVPKGSTGSVGTVGFSITSTEARIAEIGFVVGRAYWGRGFCTAAVKLAIGYGFHVLGLAEVRAEVLPRNLASRRVLDKMGFRIERDVAGHSLLGSDSEDCYLYVLQGQHNATT